MPLLKREADISPSDLFELTRPELPWWVAHTRSRQEKKFARHLLSLGIPFFLPQWEKQVERSGRRRASHLPLFPGYVFFRGTPDHRQAALGSRLLAQVLPVLEQARLQSELAQLHELQSSGASLIPFDEIRPGDEVSVSDGPFQGYSGVVVRGQSRLRLLVSITMLRKTVAVEFDREALVRRPPARSARGGLRTAVA